MKHFHLQLYPRLANALGHADLEGKSVLITGGGHGIGFKSRLQYQIVRYICGNDQVTVHIKAFKSLAGLKGDIALCGCIYVESRSGFHK